jgi:hypothetical protein
MAVKIFGIRVDIWIHLNLQESLKDNAPCIKKNPRKYNINKATLNFSNKTIFK